MKKLWISILLIIASFVCVGQNYQFQRPAKKYVPDPFAVPTISITMNPQSNGWGLLGNPCAGCASLWYAVTRTQEMFQAEDGNFYYYYFFFFTSNSYYPNGNPASTYLANISFLEDGRLIFSSPYLLVMPNETSFKAWIRSTNPHAMVTFDIQNYRVQ